MGVRWRQLFGDFNRLGISFEWHEFATDRELDWAQSFHPESVELCLNLSGEAEVTAEKDSARLAGGCVGFYRQGKVPLKARRLPGEEHQFITVEFAREFLARYLDPPQDDLHPLVREVASGRGVTSAVAVPERLTARQRELVNSLRLPPVLASAQGLWYQAKAIELMGEFFFQPPSQEELFCHRHQRVARDRVDQVIGILKKDPAKPPSLEEIGRQVGCSPFYLSRTFSKETGQTIPQFLRQLRLERAADLLRTGDYNVTEVALEVGYSSLSHFSQAFHHQFGCCPGLYPMATPPQKLFSRQAAD